MRRRLARLLLDVRQLAEDADETMVFHQTNGTDVAAPALAVGPDEHDVGGVRDRNSARHLSSEMLARSARVFRCDDRCELPAAYVTHESLRCGIQQRMTPAGSMT